MEFCLRASGVVFGDNDTHHAFFLDRREYNSFYRELEHTSTLSCCQFTQKHCLQIQKFSLFFLNFPFFPSGFPNETTKFVEKTL